MSTKPGSASRCACMRLMTASLRKLPFPDETARFTSAMPPCPSLPISTYFPNCVGGIGATVYAFVSSTTRLSTESVFPGWFILGTPREAKGKCRALARASQTSPFDVLDLAELGIGGSARDRDQLDLDGRAARLAR